MAWDKEETNIRFKAYAHSSKEAMWDRWLELCEEHGLDPDKHESAGGDFRYSLYEVEFDAEVDIDTGQVRCWGVNGTPLKDPVAI